IANGRCETAGIFPLRIDDFVSLANRDPAIFANGDGGALVSVFEPRNYMRRFRSVAGGSFVVVGQGAIKWILPRREFHRRIILPARRIWVIETAITFRPLFVP